LANGFLAAAWERLAAERDRWPLWLPVALGTGPGGYFTLPVEPSIEVGWIALGLALIATVLAVLGQARWLLALLAALLLGFGLAKLRESMVATPVLNHALVVHLTGRVVSLEPRQHGERLVLDEVRSGALQPAPRRVRVALGTGGNFRPGQWLSPVLGSKCTFMPSALGPGSVSPMGLPSEALDWACRSAFRP
jgi:competence protein ComEC